jgi:hypothetical protein
MRAEEGAVRELDPHALTLLGEPKAPPGSIGRCDCKSDQRRDKIAAELRG